MKSKIFVNILVVLSLNLIISAWFVKADYDSDSGSDSDSASSEEHGNYRGYQGNRGFGGFRNYGGNPSNRGYGYNGFGGINGYRGNGGFRSNNGYGLNGFGRNGGYPGNRGNTNYGNGRNPFYNNRPVRPGQQFCPFGQTFSNGKCVSFNNIPNAGQNPITNQPTVPPPINSFTCASDERMVNGNCVSIATSTPTTTTTTTRPTARRRRPTTTSIPTCKNGYVFIDDKCISLEDALDENDDDDDDFNQIDADIEPRKILENKCIEGEVYANGKCRRVDEDW